MNERSFATYRPQSSDCALLAPADVEVILVGKGVEVEGLKHTSCRDLLRGCKEPHEKGRLEKLLVGSLSETIERQSTSCRAKRICADMYSTRVTAIALGPVLLFEPLWETPWEWWLTLLTPQSLNSS